MENGPFNNLIALVAFDQSLFTQQKAINNFALEIEKINAQQDALQIQIQKEEQTVRNLKKEVDARELALRELDEKEAISKTHFSSAANNREYQILKRELDDIQAAQVKAEDALVTAWNKLENVQKISVEKKAHLEKEAIVLQTSLEEKKQNLATATEKYAQDASGRDVFLKDVPLEWLDRYSRMRHDVHNPVVPLEGRSCSACFHELSNSEIATIARKQLIPCQGCYRFLYDTVKGV